MPFRELLQRVFNQGHLSYTGYMTALRTKDEPLLPLGTKDSLGQCFDIQNQRQSTQNIRS
jgi:hypothetical protein